MSDRQKELILYHGTSRDTAELIRRDGFKASPHGCLGPGVYVAHHDKAFRFAANCPRHGGDAGVVVKVRITFSNAKYVRGDDQNWQSQGYDACRAEYTSASTRMEWCLKRPGQVEFLAIQPIECGAALPGFELPEFEEALSLDAVRRVARSYAMYEVYFSEKDKVVSFLADASAGKQYNVYYSTGTVGTAHKLANLPLVQTFHRKADMKYLGELFHVATLTENASCDCQHRKKPRTGGSYYDASPQPVMTPVRAEEEELRAAAERLRQETEQVDTILKDHQKRREEIATRAAEVQRREAEEKLQLELARQAELQRQQQVAAYQQQEAARQVHLRQQRLRGTQCTYSMPTIWHDDIDNNFDAGTLSVAMGENCIFMLHEGGDYTWNGNVPKGLDNKLKGRQKHLPSATYASLGSSSRYYIKFADGQSQWVGPDDLTEELQSSRRSVKSVAFGEDYNTWFVVYADGYWQWAGNIPSGLSKVLSDRGKKSDLKHVSLGPGGEYYISVANGRAWWGGMCDSALSLARDVKDRITFMDFGNDDNVFIRYE